ncbi:MAG: hypothetical protein ABSH21_01765 [Verrucomicrobiia bacterium]|jgi:Na+/alanine symporter
MKIYFGKDIPEFEGLSVEVRREVWSACLPFAFKHWQTWIALSVLTISVILTGFVWLSLSSSSLLPHLFAMFIVVPCAVVFHSVEIEILRPYFREYLRRRKV